MNPARELVDSEEKYRVLFEESPDACYICDFSGIFLEGNKKAEELTGYKREELIGQSFLNLSILGKEDLVKAAASLGENVLGHPSGPTEYSLHRKDGGISIVEIKDYPISIGDKKFILGVARDVTEKKKLEKDLKFSNNRYQILFEKAMDSITVLDGFGNIIDLNQRCVELSGYEKEELLGKNIAGLPFFSIKSKIVVLSNFAKRMLGLDVPPYEVEITAKSGRKIRAEISAAVIKDDQFIRTNIVILRDITERAKVSSEVRQQKERFKSIIEHSNDIFFSYGLTNVMDYVSPQVEQLLGYSQEEALDDWTKYLYPDSDVNKQGRVFIKTALESGIKQPAHLMEFRHKNGFKVTLEIDESPVIDENGKAVGMVGAARDVTQKTEDHKFNTLRRDFAITLSHISDKKAVLEKITDFVSSLAGVDCCGIYETNSDGGMDLVVFNNFSPEFIKSVGHYNKGSVNVTLIQKGEPVYMDYSEFLKTNNLADTDTRLKEDLKGLAVIPLKIDGNTVGCMNVGSRTSTGFSPQLKNMLEALVGDMAGVISRIASARQLDEEREKLKTFINTAEVMMLALDREGKIILANNKVFQVTGFSKDELYGHNWFELCLPTTEKEATFRVHKNMISGDSNISGYNENLIRTKDGQEKLIAWHNAAVKDLTGEITGTFSSGSDITAEREITLSESQKLQKIQKYQQTIINYSARIFDSASDLATFRSDRLAQIAKVMEVDRVSCWWFDQNCLEITCGDLYEMAKKSHTSGTIFKKSDYPNYFSAITQNRYIDASSAREDSRTCEFLDNYLRPNNIYSLLDASVRVSGGTRGILCVEQVGGIRNWSQEDINFVSGMADQIAQGVLIEEKAKKTADLEKMNNLMIGRELKMVEMKRELEKANIQI